MHMKPLPYAAVDRAETSFQTACLGDADGWAHFMGTDGHRNGTQSIQANATRFPNGIKAVADYVHALGALLLPPSGSVTTTDSTCCNVYICISAMLSHYLAPSASSSKFLVFMR